MAITESYTEEIVVSVRGVEVIELMGLRPRGNALSNSSAASDVYKVQELNILFPPLENTLLLAK